MMLFPGAMPPQINYAPVLDKHRELDLLAVAPGARGPRHRHDAAVPPGAQAQRAWRPGVVRQRDYQP